MSRHELEPRWSRQSRRIAARGHGLLVMNWAFAHPERKPFFVRMRPGTTISPATGRVMPCNYPERV